MLLTCLYFIEDITLAICSTGCASGVRAKGMHVPRRGSRAGTLLVGRLGQARPGLAKARPMQGRARQGKE